MSEQKPIFRDHHLIESEIQLPLADRIRLVFGSKMYFTMQVSSQWKGEIATKSRVAIEKVFAFRKAAAKQALSGNG